MAEANADPVIHQFRRQISDNDRLLVDALNRRLELVARLKAYKESRGLEFVDPEREEWMLQDLLRANRGPLSDDGLRAIYAEVLELTKREVAGAASTPLPA
ncbi:MAG: chorismate mutase [Actinomycetota bacterium]|nr:chorismate mutase [Actinomycetota bacterium]